MSGQTVRAFAPAKINLSLHITGQRADGYHLLDSLVSFADVGDWVTVSRQGEGGLTVSGPFAADVPTDASNHILQVADAFWDGAPLTFHLEKNLPVASGIGGGSADAGACYRALNVLKGGAGSPHPTPPSVDDIAKLVKLGADLPMCALSRPCRVQGVGEQVDQLSGLPLVHSVLVNPGMGVSTPEVFKSLTQKDNPPMEAVPLDASQMIPWLTRQRNDLQPPARALVPEVSEVLAALASTDGCHLARMSGSGATCFAIYTDDVTAKAAAAQLQERQPSWWVVASKLNADVAPQLIRSTT